MFMLSSTDPGKEPLGCSGFVPSAHFFLDVVIIELGDLAGMFQNYDEFSWKSKR